LAARTSRPSALILYIGNPIVKNDQIGLEVGRLLAGRFSADPGVRVSEFSGSPLELLSEITGEEQVILVDSVSTGRRPPGSVTLFTGEQILAERGDLYPHGTSLPEALRLGRRLGLALPRKLDLVGIEVGPIREFGQSLSPELSSALRRIQLEVLQICEGLLASRGSVP
jgi:hydrogenase maturation protease